MQIDDNATIELLAEIAAVFPSEEMPRSEDLIVRREGYAECGSLLQDLEAIRGKPVTGAEIRLVHQDLTCLSSRALQWILPHYLRYCLILEGQESRMETEFLIYNLSPSEKFKMEALRRFAFLRREQIECLINFLDWCCAHAHWGIYFPEDLQKAKELLCALLQG